MPKVDIMTFTKLLQSLPNHMASTVTVMQTFDTFVKKKEITLSDSDPSGTYPLLYLKKIAKVCLYHIIERALTKELRLQGLIPPKLLVTQIFYRQISQFHPEFMDYQLLNMDFNYVKPSTLETGKQHATWRL